MSKAKKLVKKVGKVAKKVVQSDAFKYAAMAYGGYAAYGAYSSYAAGTAATAAGGGAAASSGMSWGSIASMGLTGLQGLQGYQEAQQGAKDLRAAGREQEAIDLENRLRLQEETAESARRTREQQEITESQTSLDIGASGFAGGSSLDRYADTMKRQHESDLDWMLTSGASQSDIMARESAARSAATSAQAKSAGRGGWSSIISAGSSIAQQGQKYGWR